VVDTAGAAVSGAAVDIWHADGEGVYSGFGSAGGGANGGGAGTPGGGGTGIPGGRGPGASRPDGPPGSLPIGGPPAAGTFSDGAPPDGGPPDGGPPDGGPPGGGPNPGGPNGAASPANAATFLRGTQLSDAAGRLQFTTIYPGWYPGRNVHIHVMVHVGGKVRHVGQLFFDDNFTDTVYQSTAPYSARGARDVRNADDAIFAGGGAESVLDVTADGTGYRASISMAVRTV
jgi:hypothetical protein